ncbi:hypothetical protein [Nocardia cerradoensis]|nr:hypothetical protein [Nocardia cerradoensis]
MLQNAGLARKAIARRAGIAPQVLDNVMIGKRSRKPARTVTAKTAAALFAVTLDQADPAGREFVSAIGSQRRIRALVAFGYTLTALAAELGLPRTALTPVLTRQTTVRVWRHDEIKALYERLELTPGPSEAARRMGRERRWPLPFQWDEDALDDPNAPTPDSRLRREPYRPRAVAS